MRGRAARRDHGPHGDAMSDDAAAVVDPVDEGGQGATVAPASNNELKDVGYEIFIAAVSVLSIFNMVMRYVVSDESLDTVLLAMNALLTVILFADFVYRITTAPSRSTYFFRQFGWADLLASLPLLELKVLRVFRLVRVFRLLRENGTRVIGNRLLRNRAGSALLTLLLMGILVLEFGSRCGCSPWNRTRPTPTSPRRRTPSGTSSSRSRRSATATSSP